MNTISCIADNGQDNAEQQGLEKVLIGYCKEIFGSTEKANLISSIYFYMKMGFLRA